MKNFPIIVTTGRKPTEADHARAEYAAETLGGRVVPRRSDSVAAVSEKYGAPVIVVARDDTIVLEEANDTMFFHPSMAHVRLKNIRLHGAADHLITALDIKPGQSVLDCTLGLGADAIVESYAVGEKGQVVALEASPLIAIAMGYGLAHHNGENNYDTVSAMRRVQVVNADYRDYLKSLPDKSFDAVYFDPMFRHPMEKSVALSPLRELAEGSPLDEDSVKEACRVARHRVVMKEAWYSKEFARLGFTEFSGGKWSKVRYGIIRVDKKIDTTHSILCSTH